ncbi:hypothetical protein ACEPAF_9912 [Sanghuangporus sanghuang]
MYPFYLGTGFLLIFILKRILIVSHDRRLPRLITTIQPMSAIGAILPRTPFHRGLGFPWYERKTLYKDPNLRTVVTIPLFYGRDILYTSSLTVFHQCLSFNAPFDRPGMDLLQIMGDNVVTSEGEDWKRHRRIVAPAFNHSTYRNVWETTARVYEDMLKQEGWEHIDATPPANFNKITHKLALFLIAIVGFGIPMSWSEPPRDEDGRLSIQSMIFEVASSILERSQLPKWSYNLGLKKLNQIDEAYTTFEAFMHERIAEREEQLKRIHSIEGTNGEDIAESIKDVFGRLVNARLSDGKLSLSDKEIIGNCFVFTFAGHETTANTLSAALILLALNPDKQEWVYNSIISAIGDRIPGSSPSGLGHALLFTFSLQTFDDFDVLICVLACFYEALRMYPAAFMLSRVAAKDLTLSIPTRDNPERIEQVFVKKGTPIYLDLVGMLYDSQTFPDPETFKPERWISSENPREGSQTTPTPSATTRDSSFSSSSSSSARSPSAASSLEGFIGFSIGPRSCLGHKFAKVEGVAFLTLLLRDWKVEPALTLNADGRRETRQEWEERVLNPTLRMTLGFGNVSLRLIRRERE